MINIINYIMINRQKILLLILGILVALVFIRYAEIIKDGDLWFHLAYGKFMLLQHTLVPDHTIYSWTPAVQVKIYCAWVAEILLYLMYKLGGISAFFVFRYLCITVFFVFIILSMNRNKALYNPIAWLMTFTGIFMCRAAMDIKPEIFSFVFMTITVWAWLKARSSSDRAWMYCYLIPAIMLVWVNTHGGFIFGMVFLFLVLSGEIINYLISPDVRLRPDTMRHFLISVFLCLVVVFLTPYGIKYPVQLFYDMVLNSSEQIKDLKTIGAYQTIFHEAAKPLHFINYLIISSSVLILLFLSSFVQKRLNWALLVSNIGLGILYTQFIRTTYFWGVLCVFSAIELLGHDSQGFWHKNARVRRYLGVLAVVLALTLTASETYQAVCKPSFGFRINYYSPVIETEYIRDHLKGYRLGNDYNCGTYLLWKLWPETKVFIDARYFPYRQWYNEYAAFLYGKDKNYKDDFIDKSGCEVWCATYDFPAMAYFINSDKWQLVYYGPSAGIFARKELAIPVEKVSFKDSIATITTDQSLKIMNFAVSAGDIDNAVFLARNIDKTLCSSDMLQQISLSYIRLGDALNKKQRMDDSIIFFEQALSIYPLRETAVYNTLGTLYLHKHEFDRALGSYRKALDINPAYLPAINNMAVVYTKKGDYEHALACLNEMVKLEPDKPENYYNIACLYARQDNPDEALKWLDLAVKKGFSNWKLLESDSDLASLKKMKGFQDLFSDK